MGSLRQSQFSSNQLCHLLHLYSFRWLSNSHVPVDTVHPSLLRSSSLSSLRWYHVQILSSDVLLVSPLDVFQTTSILLSCTYLQYCLSVMFSTTSLSLMSSFLTWSLSVWPHAHLHIFISVTSSFFVWELVNKSLVLSPSRSA